MTIQIGFASVPFRDFLMSLPVTVLPLYSYCGGDWVVRIVRE